MKLELYARHGIPEVWLLDLAGNQLAVYSEPREGGFQTKHTPATGEIVRPAIIPSVEWVLTEGKTWSVPF